MVSLGLSADRLGPAIRCRRSSAAEASLWMDLQAEYHLVRAEQIDGERIRREVEAPEAPRPRAGLRAVPADDLASAGWRPETCGTAVRGGILDVLDRSAGDDGAFHRHRTGLAHP